MDQLPQIIKAALKHPEVRVRCRRPERMAKELRKHLRDHDVLAGNGIVVLRSKQAPADARASVAPVAPRAPTSVAPVVTTVRRGFLSVDLAHLKK